MDMNAAGALHAYARQSAQALTVNGGQAQSRRLVAAQPADPGPSLPPAVAPAKQPLLTSGLDLLA